MLKLETPYGVDIIINPKDITEVIINHNLKSITIFSEKWPQCEIKYDAEHIKKLEALEKNG